MNPIRLLPLTLVLMLAGCANVLNTANHAEFACPGMPDGVMCKSPLQVYRATDGVTHDRDSVTAAPAKGSGSQTSQETFDDGSGLASIQTEKAARDKPPALPLPLHLPTHLPISQSASPSYLFTEIQPRKWSFGKAEFTGSRPVIPHLMVTPSAQPTLHDRPESGRVGSVQPVSSPQAVTGIPEAALPQAGDALLGGR